MTDSHPFDRCGRCLEPLPDEAVIGRDVVTFPNASGAFVGHEFAVCDDCLSEIDPEKLEAIEDARERVRATE
jgi:hypothetical protein